METFFVHWATCFGQPCPKLSRSRRSFLAFHPFFGLDGMRHTTSPGRPEAEPMTPTLVIAQAKGTRENLSAVLGLIEEARYWLRDKGTDQWAAPWPDNEQRDSRVLRGLEVGATWIAWAGDEAAATVTIASRANPAVWSGSDCNLADPAVYAHRLIVSRNFAGWGLGAELSDWTGLRGRRDYGARWIRVDVWTSNCALHGYYMKRGFEPCGICPDPCYPSGALLQKPVSEIAAPASPLFTELEAEPYVSAEPWYKPTIRRTMPRLVPKLSLS